MIRKGNIFTKAEDGKEGIIEDDIFVIKYVKNAVDIPAKIDEIVKTIITITTGSLYVENSMQLLDNATTNSDIPRIPMIKTHIRA